MLFDIADLYHHALVAWFATVACRWQHIKNEEEAGGRYVTVYACRHFRQKYNKWIIANSCVWWLKHIRAGFVLYFYYIDRIFSLRYVHATYEKTAAWLELFPPC